MKDYIPSKYQEKIYDFVQHGVGNAVISASAGSGKTYTLIKIVELIPDKKKCLFIAFNNAIVEELKDKLSGHKNCTVSTLHSLGFSIIRTNLGEGIMADENKYRKYVMSNLTDISNISSSDKVSKSSINSYVNNILSLIDFSRMNLAQSEREIKAIAIKYDIPLFDDECSVVRKALKWGSENTDTIDFTDMLWLPYELSLSPKHHQFDWIMFDECQDASKLSIELFLKCFKRGTRFVCVGDRNQSINMFAGSSPEAFDYLCNFRNTTVFTLPISYRCPKHVVNLANKVFPGMVARDDAPDGIIKSDCGLEEIREGDMVLARSNSTLVNLYVKLIKRRMKCYIKGKDAADSLISTLNHIDQTKLNKNLSGDGVFVRLYDALFDERDRLVENCGFSMEDATMSHTVMSIYDNILTLSILANGCVTKEDLINRIDEVFGSEDDGVCLSTVHKAKGLESDNVFIACPSTLMSKHAKREWEKVQEKNLMYVAYTRSKETLGFISENALPPSYNIMQPKAIMEELGFVEPIVRKIMGKQCCDNRPSNEMVKIKAAMTESVKSLDSFHNTAKSDETDILGELTGLFDSDDLEMVREYLS